MGKGVLLGVKISTQTLQGVVIGKIVHLCRSGPLEHRPDLIPSLGSRKMPQSARLDARERRGLWVVVDMLIFPSYDLSVFQRESRSVGQSYHEVTMNIIFVLSIFVSVPERIVEDITIPI